MSGTTPHRPEHGERSAATTVAIVLAAGGGTRFAGPTHKLLAELDGGTVVEHSIAVAVTADIGPVVVVRGADELAEVAASFGDRIHLVTNPDWADGQATSLQAGIAAARDHHDASAVVVGLGDQPGVSPEAWRRVAASDAPIAIATYDGVHRNPVRLDRSVWTLLPTDGDAGARVVARVRPDLVEPIPCPGSAADIDTLEDLRRWQNRSSTNSP